MIIQIDQSGKLEKTNVPTVIGFSNGKEKALIISATDKLIVKEYFRSKGKRKAYIYKCFAALIFLLLKNETALDLIVIDLEYPGQEALVKNHLLNYFRAASRDDIDKNSIVFKRVGKASNVHKVVNFAFKGRTKAEKISAEELLKLV